MHGARFKDKVQSGASEAAIDLRRIKQQRVDGGCWHALRGPHCRRLRLRCRVASQSRQAQSGRLLCRLVPDKVYNQNCSGAVSSCADASRLH